MSGDPTRDQAIAEGRRVAAARIRVARRHPATFAEYVLKHERTGAPIKLAPMHEEWHALCTENPRLIIWSHVEGGKGLPLDTPIPTPAGWTTMAAIRVGDVIFGSDGASARVTFATETHYGRPCYLVRFDDGAELVTDDVHRWRVQSIDDVSRDRWRVLSTGDLVARGVWRVGGSRNADGSRARSARWRMPLPAKIECAEKPLTIPPYVLGAWLGDGDSDGPVITNHDDDRAIVDRCAALEGERCWEIARAGATARYRIGSERTTRGRRGTTRLRTRLRMLGLLREKHIPAVYLRAGETARRELLAGLLDTDGTVTDKGRIAFDNMSERLARDVQELARTLGYKPTIRGKQVFSPTDGRPLGLSWTVSWQAREVCFYLPRKAALQSRLVRGRAAYRRVVAIEPVASVPTRCIQVDSADHTFLAGRDYVVTHNTQQIATARLLYELGRDPNKRFALVGATQGGPAKTVRAIARYIERSRELHRVFPKLRKGSPWTQTQLTVERDTYSKDPSLQAVGAGGHPIGSRLDGILGDDILDFANTRSRESRLELFRWFESEFLGRLTADGWIWFIGNAYYADDLLQRLAYERGYKWARYPVVDPVTGQILFANEWSPERLAKKVEDLGGEGSPEVNRQLYCIARSEESSIVKQAWMDKCLERGLGFNLLDAVTTQELAKLGATTHTGVDVGVGRQKKNAKTVIHTIMRYPDKSMQLVGLVAGRWAAREIVANVLSEQAKYGSTVSVEDNGAQRFLLDNLYEEDEGCQLWIAGQNTGANKTHPVHGVQAVFADLARGRYIIPSAETNGGRLVGANPDIREWCGGMLNYDPEKHTSDYLMAAWIAREDARRHHTDAQGGVQVTVVGPDEGAGNDTDPELAAWAPIMKKKRREG